MKPTLRYLLPAFILGGSLFYLYSTEHYSLIHGTVIEKYYYPKHPSCLTYNVSEGEYLVADDPSAKVFLVQSFTGWIPDQWILKVHGTNALGQAGETFVLVQRETWLSNHPGMLLIGPYGDRPPVWK